MYGQISTLSLPFEPLFLLVNDRWFFAKQFIFPFQRGVATYDWMLQVML